MLSSRAHNGKKRPAPGVRLVVRRTMLYEVALEAATPRPSFAGTPEQVADGLQAWVDARATDGFIVRGGTPAAFTDFATKVVPLLQERGAYRRDYEGATLREHLGLDYPVNQFARRA